MYYLPLSVNFYWQLSKPNFSFYFWHTTFCCSTILAKNTKITLDCHTVHTQTNYLELTKLNHSLKKKKKKINV